jgi:transcriptional regulator with XRE-family HTH domain
MNMYGPFLRNLRKSQNLTQRQLSEIVGIAPENLSAYENDRQLPSFDMVNKLVNGCGYTLAIHGVEEPIQIPLAKGGWTPCEEWPERDALDPQPSYQGLNANTTSDVRAAVIERVLTGVKIAQGSDDS